MRYHLIIECGFDDIVELADEFPTSHHVVFEAMLIPGLGYDGSAWCPVGPDDKSVGRDAFFSGDVERGIPLQSCN